jgi:uncharacterized protein (TIGR01777 family)
MRLSRFTCRTRVAAPAETVFAWHERPGALQRLTPPWERVRVVGRAGGVADGERTTLRVSVGPASFTWVALHRDYVAGRQFRDEQIRGPFARWIHTHRIQPDGPEACWIEDDVEYALPGGWLGASLGGSFVRTALRRMFTYRHAVLRADLESADTLPPRRLALTGAGGLIGSALAPFLTTQGHAVVRMVRGGPVAPDAVSWDPERGLIDPAPLEGLDAVIHLAGENIAAGRWTSARKAAIRSSRVEATRRLCEGLAGLRRPPAVLLCASATGAYGARGDERLTETSPRGTGFLAEVCEGWEAATALATQAGIRVVQLRFGLILTPAGGALARMLLPFRLGLGGRIGSGRQYWSWIALDDVLGAARHALASEALRGPVNVVAPAPVTNAEFTQTLARVLRRPALLPVPAAGVRLVLGEMADALLLAGARVAPDRLLDTGYRFRFPDLEGALRHLLGRVQ